MVHGDYVPNIAEREALCKEILAARAMRDSIIVERWDMKEKTHDWLVSAKIVEAYDRVRSGDAD